MAMKKFVQNFNSSWRQSKLDETKSHLRGVKQEPVDVLLCYMSVSKKCVKRRVVYRLKFTLWAGINAESFLTLVQNGSHSFVYCSVETRILI